ncbi:MAG: helix-turn-helix domain-containing protein [Verrucomicrobiales bacterium]
MSSPKRQTVDPASIWENKDLRQGFLAALIRETRLKRGLKVRELAKMADCDPGFLSRVERGIKRPSSVLLDRLLDVLGIEQSLPTQMLACAEPSHSRKAESEEETPVLTVPYVVPGGGKTLLPFELMWMLGEFLMSLRLSGYKPEILDPLDEEKENGELLRIRVLGKGDNEFEFSVKGSRNSTQE